MLPTVVLLTAPTAWVISTGAPNCSALLPPGTTVRSSGCCRPTGASGNAAVPCSAAGTPFGDCATDYPKTNTPQYHVMDKSCDENDPNAPFFDVVHGVYHL